LFYAASYTMKGNRRQLTAVTEHCSYLIIAEEPLDITTTTTIKSSHWSTESKSEG